MMLTLFSCVFLFGLGPGLGPVGGAIPVQPTASPSNEDIESLHRLYLQKLTELFENHKTKYGIGPDQHLTFT